MLRLLISKQEAVMDADFVKAVEFVLAHEGGYVNDPDDSGGETKFGISKKSYPKLDIKNMTVELAKAIYRRDFWLANSCDMLKWPLNLVVFDTAVNLGSGRARAYLSITNNPEAFLALRVKHYRDLVQRRPRKKKFLRGWMNRIADLRKAAGLPPV